MTSKETVEQLKAIVNKKFGVKAIQTFDEDDDLTIPRFSSGILSLDLILGRGSNGYGWPVGRVCEIFGPESQGKTTVALAAVAEIQRNGGVAAYIDAEQSLNLEWAKKLGVNTDEMMLCQPDSAEQGYDIVEALANSGDVRLIVVDSVPAMVPEKIVESEMGDKFMDNGAALNTMFLRKIARPLNKNNCTLLLINQLREKVGVMFGNPETTPGGRALKFYSSIRLDIRRTEVIKDGGNEIGHIVKAMSRKNKTANPMQLAEFKLIWGKGFDKNYCLMKFATQKEVIRKRGAWYETDFDETKYHGSDALTQRLASDECFRAYINRETLERV